MLWLWKDSPRTECSRRELFGLESFQSQHTESQSWPPRETRTAGVNNSPGNASQLFIKLISNFRLLLFKRRCKCEYNCVSVARYLAFWNNNAFHVLKSNGSPKQTYNNDRRLHVGFAKILTKFPRIYDWMPSTWPLVFERSPLVIRL